MHSKPLICISGDFYYAIYEPLNSHMDMRCHDYATVNQLLIYKIRSIHVIARMNIIVPIRTSFLTLK